MSTPDDPRLASLDAAMRQAAAAGRLGGLVRRLRDAENFDAEVLRYEAADAIEFLLGEIDAHAELAYLLGRMI